MRSMTGYGSGEASSNSVKLTVEMSAVNRKQADIVVNIPRTLAELEPMVKRAITEHVSRGRVAVHIQIEPMGGSSSKLEVDDNLASEYFQAIKLLNQIWGNNTISLSPADLLRAPGVFTVKETEVAVGDVEPLLEDALTNAFQQLLEMQDAEGAALQNDLVARLQKLQDITRAVADLAPKVKVHYRAQLQRRLADAGLDLPLEDDRILKEFSVYAERCDISEELTRLESHFVQFRKYFDSEGATGRSMDFLCQEVNRELNTIGSKANDAAIAQHVVEAKTELEKIREQVQNVQ